MKYTSLKSEVSLIHSIFKYTFGLVPIIAGADKFFNLLANWGEYIPANIAEMLPMEASVFMMIIGLIEISAGILVFTKTKLGAYVVASWLILIAITLLLAGRYDVAVRDLVMAVAAFVLARLSPYAGDNQIPEVQAV